MKNYNLITGGFILSLPGILSITISLLSIPIHLKIAGSENYGNYIMFHFLLTISIIFNFGIGKSIVISSGNYPLKKNIIAYQGLKYTLIVCLFISIILMLTHFMENSLTSFFFLSNAIFWYFFISTLSTIIYLSLEGIFQGSEKYKTLSFYNFFFFSLSLGFPSLSLIYSPSLNLENLLCITTIVKIVTIVLMFISIITNNMMKRSKDKLLLNNLKKNSKWITLNSILVQFYDIFDKYLIRIFFGPIALAAYAIPQQLTGKLSIFSKGFSAFLLTTLSKKKIKNELDQTIIIFLKIIPALIFLLFPIYSIFLTFWLGDEFNKNIYELTKIFSLSSIFACTSHILISKFEASQTLKRNLKFEFLFMPFFLIILYLITSRIDSLTYIALVILFKETTLLFLRLNLLKLEIKNIINYYLYSIFYILMLYISFINQNLFYLFEILLLINIFKNDK
tara:strand:- start:4341 stop:5693 length:1353 start_codon:yes stop_codon:yes gene_type:complete